MSEKKRIRPAHHHNPSTPSQKPAQHREETTTTSSSSSSSFTFQHLPHTAQRILPFATEAKGQDSIIRMKEGRRKRIDESLGGISPNPQNRLGRSIYSRKTMTADTKSLGFQEVYKGLIDFRSLPLRGIRSNVGETAFMAVGGVCPGVSARVSSLSGGI